MKKVFWGLAILAGATVGKLFYDRKCARKYTQMDTEQAPLQDEEPDTEGPDLKIVPEEELQ